MKRLFFTLVLVVTGFSVAAQEPYWPCYESLVFPLSSEEKEECVWDPYPFALNPDSPFLNLLTEQKANFETFNCDGMLNKWRIGGDVTTFFRDAEFSTQHTRGYTAVGYFFTPHVSTLFRKDAQLTLGADLTGIAGLDGFWKARPLVRLEYKPTAEWMIVMGTLYGGNSHRLYEPMWCLENTFLDHTEQGLEIFNGSDVSRLQGDTWLNWQDFLQPWEAKQEVFTAGTSQLLRLKRRANTKHPFQITMPLSFVGQHHGGQFTALDTCVTSLFNESVGLSADFAIGGMGFYDGRWLSVAIPFFAYQNASPGKGSQATPYAQGYGIYPQITYQQFWGDKGNQTDNRWRRMTAQLAYWYGSQWIAPVGSYHFQSVSWHKPNYVEPTRTMLTSRFSYEGYRKRITLGADLQLYYDLAASQMDCAFGLYMRARL